MAKKLRAWITTPAETRTAWITASLCVVVIIGAFLWPQLKPDSETVHVPAKAPATVLKRSLPKTPPAPVKPAAQPKQIAKPVEKAKSSPQPKKSVKAATAKTVPATSLATGYYVQLGAFKDSKRAKKLSKKLAPTWKTHIASRPNGMIAVWVGPYKTNKEAARYRDKIASTTKLKGFVVKH